MSAFRERLVVRHGGHAVGHLDAGPDHVLTFTYDRAWLARPDAFAVSLSLPRRLQPYVGGAGHGFFVNLLPEGAVREAITGRLGISADNDEALLRAIGGECAGALTILPDGEPPPPPARARYEVLNARRLQTLAEGGRTIPLLAGGPRTRLSLAGAQDKVPVAVLDDKIHLPVGDAPSTHILKLPHAEFKHVPANELFVLRLARRLGFDVNPAELVDTDPPSLLIERYDRARSDDPWPAVRLHQEDLCQAMGLPPTRKYEQEGGPSLAAAIELVRRHVRQPLVDVQRMIEWQAFNLCAGNSDGHGKNLSLLYSPAGARLAPFYDLLSTRQYTQLDRFLAMGVGGRRDPDKIGRAQWEALATELGMSARVVVALVDRIAARCLDAVPECVTELRRARGMHAIIQTVPQATIKRARRLRRALV